MAMCLDSTQWINEPNSNSMVIDTPKVDAMGLGNLAPTLDLTWWLLQWQCVLIRHSGVWSGCN